MFVATGAFVAGAREIAQSGRFDHAGGAASFGELEALMREGAANDD